MEILWVWGKGINKQQSDMGCCIVCQRKSSTGQISARSAIRSIIECLDVPGIYRESWVLNIVAEVRAGRTRIEYKMQHNYGQLLGKDFLGAQVVLLVA
jgi:hypothetical protein